MSIIIPSDSAKLQNTYAVYVLYTLGEVVYVGYCKLTELFRTPDARRSPLFKNEMVYQLEIAGGHFTKLTAQDAQRNIIANYGFIPVLNKSLMNPIRSIAVRCIDTGEQWGSVKDAANAHGMSVSTLSSHLNGRSGFKTIYGRKYEKV